MATNSPNARGLTSVMSFKDRGPFGRSSWRGNCSGYPIMQLARHYRPRLWCDPAVGSGTSIDVSAALREEGMQHEFVGLDLHSGFNLLRDRLRDRPPREADWTFFHPPYHDMVKYSGAVYGTEPHPDDLSRCGSYEEFLAKLEMALFNIYEATRSQGVYTILIGDLRRNGQYFSIQADIIKMAPGKLEGVLIKEQHNCVSDSRVYSGRFIPIAHEYLLSFGKPGMVFGLLDATLDVSRRLKVLSDAAWDALIETALRRLGGEADLQDIYKVIEETVDDATASRPNWQAKVRQRLHFRHQNTRRGRWAIAA